MKRGIIKTYQKGKNKALKQIQQYSSQAPRNQFLFLIKQISQRTQNIHSHQVLSSPRYCLQHKRSMHMDAITQQTRYRQSSLPPAVCLASFYPSCLDCQSAVVANQSPAWAWVELEEGTIHTNQVHSGRTGFQSQVVIKEENILNWRVKTLRSQVKGGGGGGAGRLRVCAILAQTDRIFKNKCFFWLFVTLRHIYQHTLSDLWYFFYFNFMAGG